MKVFLFFIGLMMPFLAMTQAGRLASFSAIRLNRENVQINWTMKAGVSCQSPEVQRSLDSLEFTSIYRYPGVCGGGATEESFSWIDSKTILGSDIYYRLKIDDGEYSRIDLVEAEVALDDNAVKAFPLPAQDKLFVAYREELGKLKSLSIFDLQGNEIRADILGSLSANPLTIQLTALASNLYILRLTFEDGESRQLKFIKQD